MPTILPPVNPRPRKPKHSWPSVIFNAFLLVSALALTFVVLLQEERYALGQTTHPVAAPVLPHVTIGHPDGATFGSVD